MTNRFRRAMANRDAIRPRRHLVVFESPRQPWDRYRTQRAWCAKPGCLWTWDGIGSASSAKAEHESLNQGAAPVMTDDQWSDLDDLADDLARLYDLAARIPYAQPMLLAISDLAHDAQFLQAMHAAEAE
jgi:hypothetical protein